MREAQKEAKNCEKLNSKPEKMQRKKEKGKHFLNEFIHLFAVASRKTKNNIERWQKNASKIRTKCHRNELSFFSIYFLFRNVNSFCFAATNENDVEHL